MSSIVLVTWRFVENSSRNGSVTAFWASRYLQLPTEEERFRFLVHHTHRSCSCLLDLVQSYFHEILPAALGSFFLPINLLLDLLRQWRHRHHRPNFLQRSWLEWCTKGEAFPGRALSNPWKNGTVQFIGRLGWKHPVTLSEARWQVLAASGLSSRSIFWRFHGWSERAAGESCRFTRWLPCLFGRRHDHRRSSSHISIHAQHLTWDQGWDWCQPFSLGHLDSCMDCRGE